MYAGVKGTWEDRLGPAAGMQRPGADWNRAGFGECVLRERETGCGADTRACSGEVRRHARWVYPKHYPWFVALAMLDVTLTWIVLGLGATELNAIAQGVIARGGLLGMIAFKLMAVLTVLAICEYVGARRLVLGRRVMELALIANTIPVMVACLFLVEYSAGLMGA